LAAGACAKAKLVAVKVAMKDAFYVRLMKARRAALLLLLLTLPKPLGFLQ